MSCYLTFGGYRNRKRIARNAVEWFIQHRKLNRFNTFIHVVDKRLWPEDDGACKHLVNSILPEISLPNQDGNDLRLNRTDTFRIILYFFP